MMTGHNPAELGFHAALRDARHSAEWSMPAWLDPKHVTLPRLLKQAGYVTGHVGKWHLLVLHFARG